MDFVLNPEQELMRETARRLSARELQPLLDTRGPEKALSRDALLMALGKLAELGLTAARLPESAGGAGLKMLDYGIMLEQVPPPIAISLIAHEASLARLHADGNEEQRARLLPDLIAGKRIFCTGSTEPDTGSDPRGVRSRLSLKGGKLLLDGRKMWITNVADCDAMLVTCLDQRGGAPAGKVAKIVIDRRYSKFQTRPIATIGLRQGTLGEAVFEGCEVQEENVLAGGQGTETLKTSWAVNRPLMGLLAVNMAQRAFDIALEYSKVRKQFGKPIGGHQLVQKNLSDIATSIMSSRLLCYYALSTIDNGSAGEGVAAMAKRHAQNACQEAIWQAMNVLGALGLSTEAKVEALYRDVRMIAVPDGTNEVLALIHGRELTGLAAFRGAGA
jgi:alkylation response protein AidB-like acyl-CoA dehydrogenase